MSKGLKTTILILGAMVAIGLVILPGLRQAVERLRSVIKTDVAFVELGVLLVDECLAHVAGAERPEQIDGKRCGCVADGERAFFCSGEELVAVWAGLKRQVGALAKAF